MKRAGAAIIIVLTIMVFFAFNGCKELGTWEEQERLTIDKFLKKHDNGDTLFIVKESGLYFAVITEGDGPIPVEKDTVEFFYRGMFLDEVVFDAITPETDPFKYLLGSGEAIAGIDEGIRYMKQGGKYLLLTPSSLAFGPAGVWGIIPGYTPLLWEIEIDSVIAGPVKRK